MKKEHFLFIVIVLLIVLNVILLYKVKYWQDNKKKVAAAFKMAEYVEKTQSDLAGLKHAMLYQQLAEATPCADILINDIEKKETIGLKSLLREGSPILFFRFAESHCDACVSSATKLLADISAGLPRENIVVLSGFNNTRQFYAYAQTNKGYFRVFNVNTLPVAAENQESPYFFVVTPDLKIQNVFIVNNEDVETTSTYLHNMGHKYWDLHVTDHSHE